MRRKAVIKFGAIFLAMLLAVLEISFSSATVIADEIDGTDEAAVESDADTSEEDREAAGEDSEADVPAEGSGEDAADPDSSPDDSGTDADEADTDDVLPVEESTDDPAEAGEENETPAEDHDSRLTVDNGIPVIYLNIDESQGTIEDMIASEDHSVYCYGTVSIIVPQDFHYVDFPDLACESFEDLVMSIRGRGNSTWSEKTKKPFKIKLDKKADLFGLGKNKHWVLVANVYDTSLLKDRITAWMGDELGFAFTPRGVPVDVVMTGENFGTQYLGSYYFSENVRVDDNRLNIAELNENDTDPQLITGGYLLQNSMQVREGSPDKFETSRGAKWATHTPSFDTEADALLGSSAGDVSDSEDETDGSGEDAEPESFEDDAEDDEAEDDEEPLLGSGEEPEEAFVGCELGDAYKNPVQQQYIQKQIQLIEDAIYEGGTAYRELVDIESAAKYWLVQMVTKNNDAYATGSTYIYKDRDVNGQVSKLYWGPLWDFDFGYDRNMITAGMDYGHEWLKPMFCDRTEGGFVQELHKQWPAMRAALVHITEDGGMIDQYYAETKASADQDYLLYHQDGEFDYHEYTEHLKNWIKGRIAWLDENFSMIDNLVHQVTFIVDEEIYNIDFLAQNEYLYGNEAYPDKEGFTFTGWRDEDGNVISGETALSKDITLTANYIADSEVTHGQDIAFSKNNDIVQYNTHVHMYDIPFTVIPTDAVDKKVEWTSSDESFATVDENGSVTYQGPGEVTFTAKLKYGAVREYHLTIQEGPVPVPERIYTDEEEIFLAPGQQTFVTVSTDPSPAKIRFYEYETDDPGVASVGEYGVVTAAGLGRTKLHIVTTSFTDDDSEVILETDVTVIVTEDGKPEEDESEEGEPEDGDSEGSEPEGDDEGEGGEDDPADGGDAEPEGSGEDSGDPEDEGGDTPDDQGDEGGETPDTPDDEGSDTPEPPTLTVPDVTNMTLQAVQQALTENQFTYTIATEDTNNAAQNDLVIRTDPAAGTIGLPAGTMITVYLGHYVPKKVTVPDVKGKLLPDAKAMAEASGLKLTVIETETETAELNDTVFRQEPEAGTEVDEGSALVLLVYKCNLPENQEEPDPLDGSSTNPAPSEDFSTRWRERPIPKSFDLRNVDTDGDGRGDRCFVPAIRLQNPFGSCWGFAATAAAEISILGSIKYYDPDAYKTINLSEKQVVYFSHMPLDDPDNPQNGEGTIPLDVNDAMSIYNTGGLPFLAAATYAQGIGPSEEDKADYGDLFKYFGKEQNTIQHYFDGAYRDFCYSDQDDWTIPEEYRFNRDYYLTESFLLPSPSGKAFSAYEYDPEITELIKEQILDKRGVCIGFTADTSLPDQGLDEEGVYLNFKTWAHYTWSDNAFANHAVVIIGWDDNYPKENFLDGHQPPENGAWLVRNSWGSGECDFPDRGEMNWGIPVQKKDENGKLVFDENGDPVMVGSGYFWLSYYDRSIINPESFVFSDSVAPEYVDQHDYLPINDVAVTTSDTPVKMANVFTPEHSEILTGISCMTAGLNTKVSYEIYLLCNDFSAPDEGLLAARGSRTFKYGGYHKIDLDMQVFIQAGQPYSIILSMTGEDGAYVRNDAVSAVMGDKLDQKGVINKNESFLYQNDGWKDYQQVTEEEIPQKMMAASMIGDDIRLRYISDNFPIKGYGNSLVGDISMTFNVSNKELVMIDGYNTTRIRLYFRGIRGIEMGNPVIKWTFLKGSEEIADITPQKENSQILLTAKKAGTVYLAVSLDDQEALGTAVIRIEIRPAVPARAMPAQITSEYTGDAITPLFIVFTEEDAVLSEGKDYTIEYSDNIRCGIGKAIITAVLEDPDAEVPAPVTGYFMIIPPKAEILEAEGYDQALRISFADDWEIGAEGFMIEYRKTGSADWIVESAEKGETEYTIQDLESGASYEVRIRSYIVGIVPGIEISMDYYSEYSDTEVITVK